MQSYRIFCRGELLQSEWEHGHFTSSYFFLCHRWKNGEELGNDEEQIVLFVYLLYDVSNCKVIAVQQHYVKPQPNELSETVLTEDCKLETGLNEEVIKNAQPLEVVLDEFERFLSAKGVHPENGGKSFCLLTDGQSHLRQCLHPETCTKNYSLPSYFSKFYDLRNEFKKYYKTDNIQNIKSMLDCILLTSHLYG
ncbi:ESRP1_2 [Mytilus edulis]|uniref:ESRP1_2 n=1 Tax=Mytilus edulis TaxID=6550 RepID=A0A8S3ST03_MYTED|nr:ESRP1_2 [Mytilus edulis]